MKGPDTNEEGIAEDTDDELLMLYMKPDDHENAGKNTANNVSPISSKINDFGGSPSIKKYKIESG